MRSGVRDVVILADFGYRDGNVDIHGNYSTIIRQEVSHPKVIPPSEEPEIQRRDALLLPP